MYNDDIDGVTIDPLGQDVHAGQSRTPPTRRKISESETYDQPDSS